MRLSFISTILSSTLSLAGLAQAESPSPALAGDRGAEAYRQAEEAYAVRDVEGARARMQEAYDASGRSELLYNLGQLDRELGHCEKALAEYRDYLRLTKEPEHRSEAETYANQLEQRCPEQRAKLAPVASPSPAAEARYFTTPRIVAWSLIGTSVVAAAASTYFALSMRSTENETEAFLASNAARPPQQRVSWSPTGADLVSQGEREQTWAWATGTLAVASAVTGAVILWRAGRAESPAPSLSIAVTPRAAMAGYRLQF